MACKIRAHAHHLCLIVVLVSLGSVHAEPQIPSRTAKIDNVELHYLTVGHGPGLILLHGFAETSRMWRPIIPLLAEKFTVIAPDLPASLGNSFQHVGGLAAEAFKIAARSYYGLRSRDAL